MHNIHYWTYDENTKKAEIMADIHEQAECDGDGYHTKMIWHDEIQPFETFEEAEKFIKAKDTGWYSDHAVRFKDYSNAVKTKRIEGYEEKIKELSDAKREYSSAHSVHRFKAKLIGCEKCESKINKDFMHGEVCPVCRADLRSKTTIEKLKWYDEKIEDYRNRIKTEKAKLKKLCTVKWLVKFEYHS